MASGALRAGVVALGLVGCGGSSQPGSTHSSGSGSSAVGPNVTAAVLRLTHESYREQVAIHTRYDTSGLSVADAGRFAAAPTAITARSEFESPRRISIVESIPPKLANVHLVLYDGASYIAADGTHYQRLTGALATTLGNLTSVGTQQIARYLTNIKPLGAETVDGQAAEHYSAMLDPNGVRSLTGRLGALGVNADAIGIATSRVDIFVGRPSGQLVKLTTVADTTLDLAKLRAGGAGQPKGTLKIHQDVTADISDTGAKITVTPPATGPLGA